MEPNQQNINILSCSFSSSSSGNLQNMSKNSEKMKSKKSILRKEGSQSKNKDKHATFAEPLNQVAFYIPDMYNQNKNHRISLNTVSEEPENSRSGSDLANNLSSNRASLNSEIRTSFIDNNTGNKINNIFTYNESNIVNNINRENNYLNNYQNQNNNIESTHANYTNQFNNNIQNINNRNTIQSDNYKNQQNININKNEEIKNVVIKNKNIKKPQGRKTLDSAYSLDELNQNDVINNYHPIQNNHEIEEEKEKSKISNRNPKSKFVKVRLSNSGNNPFLNNNSYNNINQNNPQINNNISNLSSSNNSTNEKIEEQTKINTEANKNLFNIKNDINLNINSSLIPQTNNNIIPTSIIGTEGPNIIDTQLNNNISKKNKKPNFTKRITIGNRDDFFNDDNGFNTDNNINNLNLQNNFNNNINSITDNNIQFNNINTNINNNINNINDNKRIQKNIEKKAPKMNKKRITMAISSFEDENLFSDDIIIDKPQEPNKNNNINKYKSIFTEEPVSIEPIIKAEEKNINYANYEKYLKYNNDLVYPLSERKADINFGDREIMNQTNVISQTKRKTQLNDALLHNLESFNRYNNRNKFNLNSSPLFELIHDRPSRKAENEADISVKTKYSLNLNNNDNFDFEKEINNQINFIQNNLEEKEKIWREIIIQNAERHQAFETEKIQNQKELTNIDNKINELNNQINDSIKNINKYDKLSEKGKKLNDILIGKGIDIKDIEHIIFKEMNCLLFTVMIKNNLVYKFLISDNIWYEKNLTGDTEVTFLGVVFSQVFENYFSDIAIINTNKNMNLLIQKYFREIIKKIYPNEYETLSINKLSHKYFLSTQISLCYIHILKIITYIGSIDEDMSFITQDLKKYFVKFSFVTIYGAKLNFEYIFNIENPFSGNCLNAIDIEKNDYILDDFDEYRKKKINIIWKYFNPKDVQINEKYFSNLNSMLLYIDESDVYKKEINDEYIFNVMQGNILPNEEENLLNKEDNINFDSLELFKQLEIMYGKESLNKLKKDNQNENNDDNKENPFNANSKDIESEEIILDLPSSKDDEENGKDSKENIEEI